MLRLRGAVGVPGREGGAPLSRAPAACPHPFVARRGGRGCGCLCACTDRRGSVCLPPREQPPCLRARVRVGQYAACAVQLWVRLFLGLCAFVSK